MPLYDAFEYRRAQLLDPKELSDVDKNDSLDKLQRAAINKWPKFLKRFKIDRKTATQPYKSKMHIRVENFIYHLSYRGKELPIKIRLRLNPCFAYPGNEEMATKIWVNMINAEKVILPGDELLDVLAACRRLAVEMAQWVLDLYVSAMDADKDSKPTRYYDIQLAAMKNTEPQKESFQKLISPPEEERQREGYVWGRNREGQTNEFVEDLINWGRPAFGSDFEPDADNIYYERTVTFDAQMIERVELSDTLVSISSVTQMAREDRRAEYLSELFFPTAMQLTYAA